jgi:hypothetical protein
MPATQQHLATNIVECVQFIHKQREKLKNTEASKLLELANESLQDVEAKLCQLISQIITTPLSGRLVMPYPAECLTTQQKQFSLYKQLNLDK